MRAVVFDFDGVIMRSMDLHARAYQEAMRPLGVHVSPEQVYQLEGGRSQSLIRRFLEDAGRPVDPRQVEDLSQAKQQIFRGLGTPTLYEGAQDMVRTARGYASRLGMVTGTRRDNLERMIPQLLPLFDVVLAQDAYSHDKPHPEPYLKTAEALGIPARECVAVENAPYGVRSAKAAGYGRVLAITTTVTAAQLRDCGADEVVATHAELTERLRALF